MTVLLTGCFSFGGDEEEVLVSVEEALPRYYVIDVDRGASASGFAKDRVLLLKPVRVVPQYETSSILFRVGESEFQSQIGHELITEPEDMINAQLRRWLQKSGLFSQVVMEDAVEADYVLEAAVTALYGEQRPAYSPQAILEMQFFMYTGEDLQNTTFQTGLRIEADIEQISPGNVVTGWNQGLTELLSTLEEDLSDYFLKWQ
jgi:ABC-type uncharacterized transport system auxiliary subunit